MSFPGGSSPSPSTTASSSSLLNTTITSTPQLVASTIASSAPALSPHLAASSVLSSPIFPPRMVSPSLVPTAAFPVVLPAVPSSGSSISMFNPQSFPPQQALGPSIAHSVAPPYILPSMPQLPLLAQTQVPQVATVPAAQGIHTLPGTPSLFVFLAVPGLRCRGSCPGGAFPRSCCRGPWLLVVYLCITL